MNFSRGRHRDEPEINFIPLIDLLLVILIFLVVTTTYSRYAELKINLPQAGAAVDVRPEQPIEIAVNARGEVHLGARNLGHASVAELSAALKAAATGLKDPEVSIYADGQSTHQSVVNVMEAARDAQLTRIAFATQAPSHLAP